MSSNPLFSLAGVGDLAEWLGEPISEEPEKVRAGWALAAATGLVMDHTGRGEGHWDEVPGRVVQVVLACAARFFTNPEAWAYESVDDWRAGGRPVDEAGLFLTDSEKRVLNGAVSRTATSGLGIVSLSRPMPPSEPMDALAWALLYGGPS